MSLRFAYNTNGAANHRLDDALQLIKAAGYDGVALTLDIHHLDPFAENWSAEAGRVASLLERLDLSLASPWGHPFLSSAAPSARVAVRAVVAGGWVRLSTSPASGIPSELSRSTK